MSHAFAKDSRACAACVSWAGARAMSDDQTLVHVERYSVEGECRTASSQDYRKVTKGYHTCGAWAALPMLKKHGGLPERPGHPAPRPEPAAVAAAAATVAVLAPAPAPPPVAEPVPVVCRSERLDLDKIPPPARLLYVYWHRLRQKAGALPRASEVDTAQLRGCVSRLCLVEAAPGGADFVYRACGRALQRRMGLRPVTRRVGACHPDDAAVRLLRDLRACLAEGEAQAFLVRDDPILPGARFVDLLLPLTDERGRPAMVLAYRHMPGN